MTGGPYVPPGSKGAVTGDIQLYPCNDKNIALLDYEGENASDIPYLVLKVKFLTVSVIKDDVYLQR